VDVTYPSWARGLGLYPGRKLQSCERVRNRNLRRQHRFAVAREDCGVRILRPGGGPVGRRKSQPIHRLPSAGRTPNASRYAPSFGEFRAASTRPLIRHRLISGQGKPPSHLPGEVSQWQATADGFRGASRGHRGSCHARRLPHHLKRPIDRRLTFLASRASAIKRIGTGLPSHHIPHLSAATEARGLLLVQCSGA
jgi:hypothetical protein